MAKAPKEVDLNSEQFRKIFIGGLSFETTEEKLKEYFNTYGTVVDCVVMKDAQTKKSRGFGFVTFAEAQQVEEVQKARPHKIDNKEVETKRAVPRENNTPEAHVTVRKIFLGGIRDAIGEEDIKDHFSQFGEVDQVEMKVDRDGKKRGFCFVSFKDYDPVDKCTLIRIHNIKDHPCEAKKAISRTEMDTLYMNPRNMPRGGGGYPPHFNYGGGGGYARGGGAGYGGYGGFYNPSGYNMPGSYPNEFDEYGGYGGYNPAAMSGYSAYGGAVGGFSGYGMRGGTGYGSQGNSGYGGRRF